MKKLWDCQEIAFKKFSKKPYFGLLFDCGVGKTITTLAIAEEKKMFNIVIAPKNVIDEWLTAIEEELPDAEVFVYASAKRKTKKFQRALDDFIN